MMSDLHQLMSFSCVRLAFRLSDKASNSFPGLIGMAREVRFMMNGFEIYDGLSDNSDRIGHVVAVVVRRAFVEPVQDFVLRWRCLCVKRRHPVLELNG